MEWNVVAGGITSKMATSAPASARPSAKARPQPRAPPVTRAVLPLSENCCGCQSITMTGRIRVKLPYS